MYKVKRTQILPGGVTIMLGTRLGDRLVFSSHRLSEICPQWSHHYVGVPMFWPDWQDQNMRQHQTPFRPWDLALLGPERDLSKICQRYMTLKLNVKMLG